MNRLPEAAIAIRPADLQWARTEAARTGRRVIEALEERLDCGPAELTARLASTLRLPAIALEDMRALEPAFDLVSYAEATRRCCIALRAADGEVTVALGDPYDLDTQDWVE